MTSDGYQRTAQALAGETRINPASAERIEKELLRALATRSALPPSAAARKRYGGPPEPSRRRSSGRSRPLWVAAAAVLLIAASVAVWRLHQPTGVVNTAHTAPPVVTLPAVKAIEPDAPVGKVLGAPTPIRRAAARKAAPESHVITPTGFVELPWTAGLPTFESGEIVRIEVPLATLPTYGIDISAGAGSGPVEADVLIGQDGFARAIRLVTSTARSTQ